MSALLHGAIAAIVTAASAVRFAKDEPDFDPNTVTPGVIGFFAIFLIAAVTVLIVLDMNRRVRRTRYREEVRDKLAAERADGQTGAGTGPEDETPPSA
ncbi:hypothetical protein [Homoserinimonas hongtaonis]|uniref:Amino acid transporter n=1 Tax=Homoserinimonas hongtaonis TaxID=2079791 RepID=A0A2U1T044_9MICO|nr:hypothetical protein [Salinibacterium hongtaonis]AWB89774.1 hypothetical protein C2138_09720 [Salinibacterium hongtaonis]PWB97229.1 hypothetical protein DF220_04830 [Salinibacterium hongtaonis]